MTYYAKVVNGIVTRVIVAEAKFMDTFVDDSPGEWIKTSKHTIGGKHYDKEGNEDSGIPLRKNFAGKGFLYNKELDAFHQKQPYPSWTFDNDTCLWSAPIAYPDDGKKYHWVEGIDGGDWVEDDMFSN